jgi:hypothetical protein
MNLLPSNEPREPEVRRLSPAEIRERLMAVAQDIKDTKRAKAEAAIFLAPTPTKQWMISVLNNRVNELMNHATFYAKALAGIQEVG